MKPSSAKAKGRRLQNTAAAMISEALNLPAADVTTASAGQNGADIKLSAQAAAVLPLAIEVKNQERLNIWEALAQAQRNAGDLHPAVVFSRNRAGVYIALKLEDFLEVLSTK